MIIIVDFYSYNIEENNIAKKSSAELNISNGLLRVHADNYQEGSQPELIVNIFGSTQTIFLKDYKFEEIQDSLYYTTFLKSQDLENVQELFFKHKKLFS